MDMQGEVAQTVSTIRSRLDSATVVTQAILQHVDAGTVFSGWEIVQAAKLARELNDSLNYLGLLMWKLRRETDPTTKHPAEIEYPAPYDYDRR